MEESNKSELKAELIYGLNDRPPLRETLFAALQHLLAIFVAIITPPLIIAGALKLDIETTSFLVSMEVSVRDCCAYRARAFLSSVLSFPQG